MSLQLNEEREKYLLFIICVRCMRSAKTANSKKKVIILKNM